MDKKILSERKAVWPSCVKVSPLDIDLGAQLQGTSFAGKEFTIENLCSGTRNFSISETKDWIKSVAPAGAELDSTDSVTISISGIFPDYEAGEFEGEVKLAIRPEGATNFVRIHGVVKTLPPELMVSPTTINLGIQPTGGTFSGSFTVRNTGGGTLEGIISANRTLITLLEPEYFSIKDVATIDFRGKFPTAPGTFSTRITVNSDGGNGAVDIVAEIRQSPILNLQPPEPEIPDKIPIGSTFNSSFALRNIGGGTLMGTVSANRTLITLLEPEYFSIEDVAKVTFQVRFPTTPGPFSTIIDVNSNGGNGHILIHCDVIPSIKVLPDKIELEPAVAGEQSHAGTLHLREITITNVGGGTLTGITIETDKDWIIVNLGARRVDPDAFMKDPLPLEANLRKLVLPNIESGSEYTFEIICYTPPKNEQFPGILTITSNGGDARIEVTGAVARELYWGTDTNTAVRVRKGETYPDSIPHTHELIIPQDFYIGRLGSWGGYPIKDIIGEHDAGKEATFAYWFLGGPGKLGTSWIGDDGEICQPIRNSDLEKHGQDQANHFIEVLHNETNYWGNTLFVDVEYPINPSYDIRYWGERGKIDEPQRKRNREVFKAFLDTLDTEWKQKGENRQLGVYTSGNQFKDIMGETEWKEIEGEKKEVDYKIPHRVVLWVARYKTFDKKYEPLWKEFCVSDVVKIFHSDFVQTPVGGYYPVIWQFAGSGEGYMEDCNITLQNPVDGFQPRLYLYPDVPVDYWARESIEKAYQLGIMSEFNLYPFRFGPEEPVLRQDAAVYVLKSRYGKDVAPPPATGTVFNDVPIDHPQASWIEKLKADGFTSGRSIDPPLYFPAEKLTRAEMAVLAVRLFRGTSYSPPKATGNVFQDVPATHWAAGWIEQLHRDDMAAGSSTDPPLYRPEDAVNRAEMAVFLMKTMEKKPGCGAKLLPIARLVSVLMRSLGRAKLNRV